MIALIGQAIAWLVLAYAAAAAGVVVCALVRTLFAEDSERDRRDRQSGDDDTV